MNETAYLLRASEEELRRWKAAAVKAGVPFSVWLRRLCESACNTKC